jgi:hypothetical protein
MSARTRAGALAPEPHRQRPLARAPVGLQVADVVDDEDRGHEHADRDGEREGLPRPASSCAKSDPATATTPKNRNTKTSPRPS